ncbi:MAG: ribose-phosphate diphosphokinase [Thermoplasmata archaeon]|nr:MAG: ribose-phosphate diphosphokinase [Thermoplasmata archaeon]
MLIVGGSASKTISQNLSKVMNANLAEVNSKRFPDDECYIRIMTDLTGEDIVLVQNTYPDLNIIELFLLQDAIKEYDIKKLVTVIPYFGYGRQDKKFNEGESISARALVKRIQVQSDAVITVDLHETSILDWFDIPARNVSAMPEIGRYLRQFNIDIVVSPDKGAAELAELTAKTLECPWDYLDKTRIDSETVKIAPKSIPVEGKRVAIVDDIIATGGTIITASNQLKEQGCDSVIVACTHGLYTGGAINKLINSLDKVISTDSLETKTSEVSSAPEIKSALLELL